MQSRVRRATAVGASAFVLAGSAALAMPGTAAAETQTVPCGSSVTAKPGDTIFGTTPLLGIPLNLGVVGQVSGVLTGTINAVLGTVCRVTVTVVNTVVSPVPVVGAPAASAINQGVSGVTNGASQALAGGGKPAPEKPAPGSPPPQQGGPGSPGAPAQGGPQQGAMPIPDANSPVLSGAYSPSFGGLPFAFSTGYAPMRDYSDIPAAMAGLFSPAPGLRYGSQIPGYAPQYGLPEQQQNGGSAEVQNAGQAVALPNSGGGFTNGAGLPVLIAVLALSGVSAGLVRTWVLRRMAATH
ncbi:hypothetical protein [Amycolatopsis sp. NPDC059021]|uniref:hypothetical protein n=1 Tax=Amycolatopsis sp. NPDC059021 TaxID=3346704 RepID=UPI003670A91C